MNCRRMVHRNEQRDSSLPVGSILRSRLWHLVARLGASLVTSVRGRRVTESSVPPCFGRVAGIAGWLFSLVTGSVLLTWLYNGCRGSLLVVALFHAAIDVAFTSESSSPVVVNAAGALITLWGVSVVVAAGPRYLSKRGKVVRLYHGPAITRFVQRDENIEPVAG